MTSLTAPPTAYRESAVLSASPAELVVMLYDGARRFMRQATSAMGQGEIEQAHHRLRRAEMIIAHLDGTLDHSQGEVADRLHDIYTFSLSHLNRARLEQDPGKVDDVSRMLGELREAWATIARS